MKTPRSLALLFLATLLVVPPPVGGENCGDVTTKFCTSVNGCNAIAPSCGRRNGNPKRTVIEIPGSNSFFIECLVKICGAFDETDLNWTMEWIGTAPTPPDTAPTLNPTVSQCGSIAANLDPCQIAENPEVPECPGDDISGVSCDPDQPIGCRAAGDGDRATIGAYVDLPSSQLANPNRPARIFFGIDGLDRLTLLKAELWGVTGKAAGAYMELVYERLPRASILERSDSHYELLLPDGELLEFERGEATHPKWSGPVETLVLTSGQSSAEMAELLHLTPVRGPDAERRREALRKFEDR